MKGDTWMNEIVCFVDGRSESADKEKSLVRRDAERSNKANEACEGEAGVIWKETL